MAGVRGGHAGVELAALTAVLITMSRYATLQDRNNTPDHQESKTNAKITTARSGPKPERCWITPQQVYAALMWVAGVEGVDGVK